MRTTVRARAVKRALLIPWAAALVGYFAPWIGRRPMSAALAWNAYDLFDLLRLLPQIERGTLTVNLQTLQMPLLGLAVLLPALLTGAKRAYRWGAALLGCGLAAMTLPPYPQILDAWRTPGWRVSFWWAIGSMLWIVASLWVMPRLGRYRSWWVVGVVSLASLPAIATLYRLMPALEQLHNAPIRPAWGAWACVTGLGIIGLTTWWQETLARRGSNL
jgi:hypothetical protein